MASKWDVLVFATLLYVLYSTYERFWGSEIQPIKLIKIHPYIMFIFFNLMDKLLFEEKKVPNLHVGWNNTFFFRLTMFWFLASWLTYSITRWRVKSTIHRWNITKCSYLAFWWIPYTSLRYINSRFTNISIENAAKD